MEGSNIHDARGSQGAEQREDGKSLEDEHVDAD